MYVLCKNCNRKFVPIFDDHIFNGSESILHGNESILNGSEGLKSKEIYRFKCPYCGKFYKSGFYIK